MTRYGKAGRLAAATLAAAVGWSVAACGGSGGPADDDGDDTITLWHMEQPPNRVQAFQQLIDEYNATDPDYRVEAEVQDWDQIYTTIPAAVASDTQPDLLFTIPDFTTYVRPIGGVRPVTELVEELDAEHGFSEAATAAYDDQGEYWAVPVYGMVQMLWYRQDLLDQAGVDPPQTTSQLLAAAEELTTDDQYGIALPAGRNLASDQVIYSLMLTGGAGDFFTDSGEIDFDTPETVDAFTLYRDLLEYSPPDSGDYSWGEPQAAFNSGAAAMAIEKGQYLAPFEEESGRPAGDLGCAPIPVADDGGDPGSIYYSNAAMVMSTDDAKADAAADFLRFILEPETYGEFLNAEPGLFLPLTEDGAQADSWTSHEVIQTYQHCVEAMLEQSETGALFGFVDGQYIDTIGQISGQNILAQVIQRIYSNGESPQDAVAWGDEEMRTAITE